jgi:hypothetical protein
MPTGGDDRIECQRVDICFASPHGVFFFLPPCSVFFAASMTMTGATAKARLGGIQDKRRHYDQDDGQPRSGIEDENAAAVTTTGAKAKAPNRWHPRRTPPPFVTALVLPRRRPTAQGRAASLHGCASAQRRPYTPVAVGGGGRVSDDPPPRRELPCSVLCAWVGLALLEPRQG